MRQQGFTLLEVLVVAAIIAIVLAIGGLSYQRWMAKLDIERQTREVTADLMGLRMKALETKLPHRAFLNRDHYVLKYYMSEDEPPGEGKVIVSKPLRYPIHQRNGEAFDNFEVAFNSRGMTYDFTTIAVNDVDGVDAGVNCVSIHYLRMNMGVMKNGKCLHR